MLFYNKVLYQKAGLDPDKPPTTLKEFADQARTIRQKVGGDVYGTFWAAAAVAATCSPTGRRSGPAAAR